MRTVATTTAIILKSMLPPAEREISSAACARSGGPRLGDLEGAAIDRSDIENFAGLARGVARDLRVPERVAVFHARVAGALVDPGVEGGRLANVEPPHTLRRHLFLVLIHPDHSGDGNDRRAYRLPDEPAVRIADSRADQGRDAEDEQVKRPRHQLDDDEDEAGDQPGKGKVHGRCGDCCSRRLSYSRAAPATRPASHASVKTGDRPRFFPPPGKNLNRTPIFHLAARYKRCSSGTETTARV